MKSPNLTAAELSTCPGEVLLVDDDGALRETAAEVLRLAGFDVTTAANGAEALAILARGPVGAILLDLRMPVLDGWSFLRHRASDPDLSATPVIILSGEPLDTAVAASADLWLTKPFDESGLIAAVARALARNTGTRQAHARVRS
jgi:CheY-like chemotaxis protein